jgi:Flp pilus assembly protein TadD
MYVLKKRFAGLVFPRLVVGSAAIALSAPAVAQMVQPIPRAGDASTTLSIHLRTLASNPRDLMALIGAGQSALDVGDPNAALGFFARAEELSPSNYRAKAGLASALVQMEKPDDALRLFGEAVSLGASEENIAADRGLAYDLRGDNRRAQKDYALALKRGNDDEVTRRYALSLGISGDKVQAMTVLDPLLRRQDQGAWRARAFIMAMNDEVAAANTVTRQVMPAALAASMSPFLSRLGKLNAAEKAYAVNFGTMPSDGQTFVSAPIPEPPFAPSIITPRRPVQTARAAPVTSAMKPVATPRADTSASDALVPAGQPLGRSPVAAAAAAPTVQTRPSQRVGARIAAVDPARLPPEARGEGIGAVQVTGVTTLPPPDIVRVPVASPVAPPVVAPPVAPAVADPKPFEVAAGAPKPAPAPPPQTALVSPGPAPAPVSSGLIGPPAEPAPMPGFSTAPAVEAPKPAAVDLPPSAPAQPPIATAAVSGSRLASILSGIEPEVESAPVALPTATEVRAAQRTAARKAADAAALASDKQEKAKEAALARANPARLWVQVATGANDRALPATWKRIRDANDKALKGLGGYSVPFKATNRVLAGPVKSAGDARTLVNTLAKNGVTATTYTSEAGQEVLKLGAK